MCNCLEKVQQAVRDQIVAQEGVKSVPWVLVSATFGPPSKATIRANYCAVIGQKNGREKERESHTYLVAIYCPFCGAKYDENA